MTHRHGVACNASVFYLNALSPESAHSGEDSGPGMIGFDRTSRIPWTNAIRLVRTSAASKSAERLFGNRRRIAS